MYNIYFLNYIVQNVATSKLKFSWPQLDARLQKLSYPNCFQVIRSVDF